MKIKDIFTEKGSMIKKLLLNQFAFSLFGIFVATPFAGNICIIAGVFSLLFYMFVVGYAILDDSQKDRISYNAGRKTYLTQSTGFKYSFAAFMPTIIISAFFTIISFFTTAENTLHFILKLVIKYIFSGEILGIDVGLTKFTFDTVALKLTTTAPDSIVFMSNHGVFQLIFLVFTPAICGFIYYLGFTGKVSVNTTSRKD